MCQKKRFNRLWKVKNFKIVLQRDAALFKIAKILGRDHRTIRTILLQIVNRVARNMLRKIKQINCQIFEKNQTWNYQEPIILQCCIVQTCNLPGVPRSTRCSVLRDMAEVRKAETRPPLNKKHKLKRQDWARKYLKTGFSKVLWTDEMRVSLDGPDGWASVSVMGTELHVDSDDSKVEVGHWYGLLLLKMS